MNPRLYSMGPRACSLSSRWPSELRRSSSDAISLLTHNIYTLYSLLNKSYSLEYRMKYFFAMSGSVLAPDAFCNLRSRSAMHFRDAVSPTSLRFFSGFEGEIIRSSIYKSITAFQGGGMLEQLCIKIMQFCIRLFHHTRDPPGRLFNRKIYNVFWNRK